MTASPLQKPLSKPVPKHASLQDGEGYVPIVWLQEGRPVDSRRPGALFSVPEASLNLPLRLVPTLWRHDPPTPAPPHSVELALSPGFPGSSVSSCPVHFQQLRHLVWARTFIPLNTCVCL